MIKNNLKRREGSDTYLAHIYRHCWSRKSYDRYLCNEVKNKKLFDKLTATSAYIGDQLIGCSPVSTRGRDMMVM